MYLSRIQINMVDLQRDTKMYFHFPYFEPRNKAYMKSHISSNKIIAVHVHAIKAYGSVDFSTRWG
jgi:hypothetical protein